MICANTISELLPKSFRICSYVGQVTPFIREVFTVLTIPWASGCNYICVLFLCLVQKNICLILSILSFNYIKVKYTNSIKNNREGLSKYLAHSECLIYLKVPKHYVIHKRKFHSLEQSDFAFPLGIKIYDGKWKKLLVPKLL